jgi:hypothetical protein
MCLAVDRELRRLDAAGDGREAAGPVMAVACETANTRATRRHQTRTEVNVAGQAIQFATTMLASAWRANSSAAASCGRFSKASARLVVATGQHLDLPGVSGSLTRSRRALIMLCPA